MMKSKETFNFRIILIMLLLCAASGVSAADSLSCDVQRRCTFDDGHRLRAVDIVVPAAAPRLLPPCPITTAAALA